VVETKTARAVRLSRERVVRAAKRFCDDLFTPEQDAARTGLIKAVVVLEGAERALRAERRRGRGR
jgi:hypothetical protein